MREALLVADSIVHLSSEESASLVVNQRIQKTTAFRIGYWMNGVRSSERILMEELREHLVVLLKQLSEAGGKLEGIGIEALT